MAVSVADVLRKRRGVPAVKIPEKRVRAAQKRVPLMKGAVRRIAAIAEMQARAVKIAARDQRAAPAGS